MNARCFCFFIFLTGRTVAGGLLQREPERAEQAAEQAAEQLCMYLNVLCFVFLFFFVSCSLICLFNNIFLQVDHQKKLDQKFVQ